MSNLFSRESFSHLYEAVKWLKPYRDFPCFVIHVKVFEGVTGNVSWHYIPYTDFLSAFRCYVNLMASSSVKQVNLQALLPRFSKSNDNLPF